MHELTNLVSPCVWSGFPVVGFIPFFTNIYEAGHICCSFGEILKKPVDPALIISMLEMAEGNTDLCPGAKFKIKLEDGRALATSPTQGKAPNALLKYATNYITA